MNSLKRPRVLGEMKGFVEVVHKIINSNGDLGEKKNDICGVAALRFGKWDEEAEEMERKCVQQKHLLEEAIKANKRANDFARVEKELLNANFRVYDAEERAKKAEEKLAEMMEEWKNLRFSLELEVQRSTAIINGMNVDDDEEEEVAAIKAACILGSMEALSIGTAGAATTTAKTATKEDAIKKAFYNTFMNSSSLYTNKPNKAVKKAAWEWFQRSATVAPKLSSSNACRYNVTIKGLEGQIKSMGKAVEYAVSVVQQTVLPIN